MTVYLREVEGSFIKIISVCVEDEKYVLNNPCGRKPTVCFAGQSVSRGHCPDSVSGASVTPASFPVSILCTKSIE